MAELSSKRSLSPQEERHPRKGKVQQVTSLTSINELGFDDIEDDKKVFGYYPNVKLNFDLSQDGSQYALYVLFWRIVKSSPKNLDQSYADLDKVEGLFKHHADELVPLLEDGWKRRSFSEIRKLTVLHSDLKVSPTPRRILDVQFHKRVVEKAWEEPYTGSIHTLLYENINAMNRSEAYSTTVAIVQSSGSGKSRMVDEQATLVFTIPFCLRDPIESRDLAYPPADTTIYSHLTNSPSEHSDVVFAHYYRFFSSLFKVVTAELTTQLKKQRSYTALAQVWRQHLMKRREQIYEAVVDLAKQKEKDEPYIRQNTKPDVATKESIEAVEELRRLLEQVDNMSGVVCSPDNVKVMLYFDEAHTLTHDLPIVKSNESNENSENNKNLYDSLCSCLNVFLKSPLFTIFLSTNSNLTKLARASRLARSSRARENSKALQAPITETPFDCSPKLNIIPNTLTWEDVSTIEFMAQFGRPLFWTLIEGASQRKDEMLSSLLKLGRAKLLCDANVEDSAADFKLSSPALAALIDCRLMLDYAPRHEEALLREIELVASHMRLAYVIPQSREYLRSGYSSEPLLAEAAAQQLAYFRKMHPEIDLQILVQNTIGNHMVDLGERGELIARFLLTLAYDQAVKADYLAEHPNDPNCNNLLYSRGCRVITFFRELYSPSVVEEVLNSKPDNVKDAKPLREIFKNARMRFTHFTKLADESGVSTEGMFAAFVRGMAFVGHNTQKANRLYHSYLALGRIAM